MKRYRFDCAGYLH